MKNLMLFAFSILATLGLQADSYSQAVVAGRFLYVSGQLPIDPNTGMAVQGDITTLTNLTLDNMQHVLHVKGYKMSDVKKTVVYLLDIRDYAQMDAAYAARFPYKYPPARDVVVVSELPNNVDIEIECIAYK